MVETIRLESGHTLTGIVGSNPTLSAIHFGLKLAKIPSPVLDSVLGSEHAEENCCHGLRPAQG